MGLIRVPAQPEPTLNNIYVYVHIQVHEAQPLL